MRNAYKFWLINFKGRHHLGDLGIDEKIILTMALKENRV
jgi:hypothetical protein